MTLDLGPAATVPVGSFITAGRLLLRPVRKSDAGLFALYAGDRRVAEGTQTIPHPLPPGAAEAWVARLMAEDSPQQAWVMDGSATGLAEVLGVISNSVPTPTRDLDWLAIGRAFFGEGQCMRLSDLTPERWSGVARPALIVADVAPAPGKPPPLGLTPAMIRQEFLGASRKG